MKLKDLADVFTGAHYSSTDLSDKGEYRFIRPRDIKDGRIQKAPVFVSRALAEKNPKSILAPGDILLQNIFDFEKMVAVKKEDVPAVASNNFFVIKSKEVGSGFLFDYLRSDTLNKVFRRQLGELAHGATIMHVNLFAVREMPVPILFPIEDATDYKIPIGEQSDAEALKKTVDEIRRLRDALVHYSSGRGNSR